MDIITRLSHKPFVHIIAQARSGSTVLYDALQWPSEDLDVRTSKQNYFDKSKDLSEPLQGELDKKRFNKVLAMVKDYEKNGVTTMKNLLVDILKYDKRLQNKMFKLPVYTVGLTRRNTFDQTCSYMLHRYLDNNPVGTLDQKYVVDQHTFTKSLITVMREKKTMFNYTQHFDEIINYEDIVFPPHITSTLNPPKQLRIINYHEVKQWYYEMMHSWNQVETVQSAGVNWSIDKTNK